MNIKVFVFLIFISSTQIKSDCVVYGRYSLLGVVTSYENGSLECTTNDESCVYATFNIPDLAIGSVQSCYGDINAVFNEIITKRLDVQDAFSDSYDGSIHEYDLGYYCQNYNDLTYSNASLSGYINLYVNCYDQGETLDYTDIPLFEAPLESITPVQCPGDVTCTEGYCGIYNRTYYVTEGDESTEVSLEDSSCITNIYNSLYNDIYNESLSGTFQLDLFTAAKICTFKDQGSAFQESEDLTYSWSINCFSPTNDSFIETETTQVLLAFEDSIDPPEEYTKIRVSKTKKNKAIETTAVPEEEIKAVGEVKDNELEKLIDSIDTHTTNDTLLDNINFEHTDDSENQAVQDLCTRVHNNTAFAGVAPYSTKTVKNAFECQKTCVEDFPLCVAVVFYFVHNKKNEHLCYYFDKNSVDDHVTLMAEAPKHEKDIIRALEIVVNCHQFDPVPPPSDDVISSSDKVPRSKRQQGFDAPIQSDETWSKWSSCRATGTQVRSQVCEYGRNIQRRGCAAREYQQAIRQEYTAQQHAAPTAAYRQPEPVQAQYPPTPYNHQDYYRAHPTQAPPQPSEEERQKALEYERRRQQYEEQLRAYNLQQLEMQRSSQQQQQQYQQQDSQQHYQQEGSQQQYQQQYQQQPQVYPGSERHPAIPSAAPCPGDVCDQPAYVQPIPVPTRPPPPPQPPCLSQACLPEMSTHIGSWSGWSEFGSCSCTCGFGIQQRVRVCSATYCIGGSDVETVECNLGECPGEWTEWGDWSTPSETCGHAISTRTRTCLGGSNCPGRGSEEKYVDLGICQYYGPWSAFGECSVTCGDNGIKRRFRTCIGGTDCEGPAEEALACSGEPCASWRPWTEWGACFPDCGSCRKTRTRECTLFNGTPSEDCLGPNEEVTIGFERACCEWEPWCPFSDCQQGVRTRSRICLRPGVGFDDTCSCPGNDTENEACVEERKQLYCQWTNWCAFVNLDIPRPCEPTVRQRTRQCVGEIGCSCEGRAIERESVEGLVPCTTPRPVVPC
uniref:Apple domain-containing protein n=1 Tax=Parastrongyloides trichosuri TaxID=131310 RepID=A0A0N4ZM45_PARTI